MTAPDRVGPGAVGATSRDRGGGWIEDVATQINRPARSWLFLPSNK